MKKLLLLCLLAVQFVTAQQPRIYYVDYAETINSVALNGTDHEVISTSFNTPVFISFDANKLYVSDNNSVNRNYRFNPDGTSGEVVHDEVSGVIRPSSVFAYNNELYFIDRDYIRKSDLDGNNIVDLVPFTSTQSKIQVVGDKIYWNGGSALRSANLDGTDAIAINDNATMFRGFWVEGNEVFYIADGNILRSPVDNFSSPTLVLSTSSPNLSTAADLTVFEGKLYYTDTGLDKIMRCNLDGTNVEEVYDIPGTISNPIGIAGHNGYIYWADTNKDTVSRIATDLTNFEVVVGDDFQSVAEIALTENELIFTRDYIKKSNPDGTTVTTLTDNINFIGETRVVGSEIFFSDEIFGITKTPINTYNPQFLVGAQTTDFISSFDVDGDFIYWIENENNTGTVYKSFIDGSNVQSIYTDVVPLYDLEHYEGRLYFTRNFSRNNLFSIDTNGTTAQSAFSVNGTMNNFVIYNGKVYFGWTRSSGTHAIVSANIDSSNAQVIKNVPASLVDIDIFEPDSVFHPDDYNALVALYNSTDGPNWTNTWDLSAPLNTYHGVLLDANNRVLELNLSNNNLVGTLPNELEDLTNVQRIFFSNNSLIGSIPSTIGNLSNLQQLFFSNNNFSGEIPAEIGNLTNLTLLGFRDNQFEGIIPASIGNLVNLQSVSFADNRFSGTLPAEMSNLSNLAILVLNDNNISGIPESLNALNLTALLINNNDLTFLDIEPTFTQFQGISTFSYAPQNKFGFAETITVNNGSPVTLTSLFADVASNNNTYQWFKDDVAIPGETNPTLSIANATPEDHAGVYVLKVNNTVVSDLELESEPITVNVNGGANYLLVTNTTLIKETTGNVDIQLLNDNDIRGFQFDFTLPTGFVFNTSDLITTARIANFETSIVALGNNSFRVLGFSLDPTALIQSGTDAIISLPVLTEASVVAGDYTFDITNITLSSTTNQDIASTPSMIGTVTVSDVALGDANGNGSVDVLDLLQTIDFILGNNPSPFVFAASDVNMDGVINILDVVGIQDIILNPSNSFPANQQNGIVAGTTPEMNSTNYLLVKDQEVTSGMAATVEIELVNDAIVRAIQFDINLPAGFSVNTSGIAAVGRLNGFTVSSSDLGNNTYRVLAFSFTNGTIPVGNDAILNIPITVDAAVANGDYTFPITGVVISDVSNMDITSPAASTGTITVSETLGISDENLDNKISVYPNPANIAVNIDITNAYSGVVNINLYAISGQLLYNHTENKAGSALHTTIDTSQLASGVYVLKINTGSTTTTKQIIVSK